MSLMTVAPCEVHMMYVNKKLRKKKDHDHLIWMIRMPLIAQDYCKRKKQVHVKLGPEIPQGVIDSMAHLRWIRYSLLNSNIHIFQPLQNSVSI